MKIVRLILLLIITVGFMSCSPSQDEKEVKPIVYEQYTIQFEYISFREADMETFTLPQGTEFRIDSFKTTYWVVAFHPALGSDRTLKVGVKNFQVIKVQ